MKIALPALLSLFAVAGCHHDGDENLGLSGRVMEVPVELGHLGEPGGLEKALAAPAFGTDRKLGPHRRRQSLHLELGGGDKSETLDETWLTEVDAQGSVHALHENSHDYGVEWFAVGGNLYFRMRHGRFVARDPQGDEVERYREEQAGPLVGYLEVLGRFATRTLSGAGNAAGRPTVGVKLALAPSPGAFTDEDPQHQWRKSIRVDKLDGEVAFDTVSGAPLAAHFSAQYGFTRGGKGYTVHLDYRSETADLGAVSALAAPADALADLERPRPLFDRAVLLDGLVPATREHDRLVDEAQAAATRPTPVARPQSLGEAPPTKPKPPAPPSPTP